MEHYAEQGRKEQTDMNGLHTEFVVTSTDDTDTTDEIGGHGTGHSAGYVVCLDNGLYVLILLCIALLGSVIVTST